MNRLKIKKIIEQKILGRFTVKELIKFSSLVSLNEGGFFPCIEHFNEQKFGASLQKRSLSLWYFLHHDTRSIKLFFYQTHLKFFRRILNWSSEEIFEDLQESDIYLISPMAFSKNTLFWNFDNSLDYTVPVTIRLDVSWHFNRISIAFFASLKTIRCHN